MCAYLTQRPKDASPERIPMIYNPRTSSKEPAFEQGKTLHIIPEDDVCRNRKQYRKSKFPGKSPSHGPDSLASPERASQYPGKRPSGGVERLGPPKRRAFRRTSFEGLYVVQVQGYPSSDSFSNVSDSTQDAPVTESQVPAEALIDIILDENTPKKMKEMEKEDRPMELPSDEISQETPDTYLSEEENTVDTQDAQSTHEEDLQDYNIVAYEGILGKHLTTRYFVVYESGVVHIFKNEHTKLTANKVQQVKALLVHVTDCKCRATGHWVTFHYEDGRRQDYKTAGPKEKAEWIVAGQTLKVQC